MIIPEMVKTCKPTQDQHISYMSCKQINNNFAHVGLLGLLEDSVKILVQVL